MTSESEMGITRTLSRLSVLGSGSSSFAFPAAPLTRVPSETEASPLPPYGSALRNSSAVSGAFVRDGEGEGCGLDADPARVSGVGEGRNEGETSGDAPEAVGERAKNCEMRRGFVLDGTSSVEAERRGASSSMLAAARAGEPLESAPSEGEASSGVRLLRRARVGLPDAASTGSADRKSYMLMHLSLREGEAEPGGGARL